MKSSQDYFCFKKDDRTAPSNCRGMSLINLTYKLYGEIMNERLCCVSDILPLDRQAGFCKGRSYIDDVFSLKVLIVKRREFKLETLFIDYEKAFDSFNRYIVW